MNLQEARAILDLSENATPEDAKKKYRELTKKYHPDINKEPDADEKFKKINEAYGCVQSGKGTDRDPPPFIRSPFNPFGGQQAFTPQHIKLHTSISFKESITGCKKDISFSRAIKCPECEGQGERRVNNGCDKCHGTGMVIQQRGNMIFSHTCDKCGGRFETISCKKCNSSGVLDASVSVQVQIPGGVVNGSILRLGGMGNYVTSMMGMDQYTDGHLLISVEQSPNLSLVDRDVVSSTSISLLEALTGCKKSVETIFGMHEISIKPKSRNKEEVIIPAFGVEGIGCQRVILDVEYPNDINSLIDVLSKKVEE